MSGRAIAAVGIGAAAVAIGTVAVVMATRSDPAPQAKRLVVVGDSLTAGRYADTRAQAFPQLVETSRGLELDALGIPGATTGEIAATTLPGGGSVLVVEVGTNDFLRQTPRAQFNGDIRALLAAATAASPGARLVCLTTWLPPDAVGRPPTSIPAAFYNRAIRNACGAGTVVDISPLYDAPGTRGPAGRTTELGPGDDFHPNTAGHAAIARLVEAALSR